MRRIASRLGLATGLLAILLLAAGPAAAQKPSWDGDGKKGNISKKTDYPREARIRQENRTGAPTKPGDRYRQKAGNKESRHRQEYRHQRASGPSGPDDRGHRFFGDRDRSPIDRYYTERFRRGKCPPGLRKKGNGCRPPGQVKRWTLHRPLPRDVIFYDLPQEVLVHLGPPPPRHRFVRVAQDILLITVGAGIVVDAIEDLGRGLD